jgi:ABC-type sugar transport system permease subunit
METDIVLQARLDNLAWSALTVVFIIIGSLSIGYVAQWVARLLRTTEAEQRRVFWGFVFASPWIIGFFIFVVGPALASLYYSFTNYRLGQTPGWIGLDNYRTLLMGEGAHGRRFSQAMFNSFYYAIVGVPLQVMTALAMAMVLNQSLRGIRLFRLIFYLPVILAGGPAILLAWRYMLASNGGFINVSLRSLADSFFVFDWLYRAFIFVVEGFNAFYTGVARGDPIGPLKYALPALIAALVLLSMARGEWTASRRNRALRAAEILGALTVIILFARGLVANPVDPALVYGVGAVLAAGAAASFWEGKPARARIWQMSALVVGLVVSALVAALGGDHRAIYLPPLLIATAPAALGLLRLPIGARQWVPLGGTLILGLITLASLVPGQLDSGQAVILPQLLTLNTTLAQPGDADYLRTTYPATTPSALWVYGLAAVVLGAIALLGARHERLRRTVILAGLVGFALLTIGALADGVRYFQAFDQIAAETGRPAYHFQLFRTATAEFPNRERVPLWMSNELWSKPSLILITMWSSGGGMLIFLAALKGVPSVFYEAAQVDGATRLQQFFKITLPMISPAMFYNLVIGIIAALQTFEAVYIIQTPQTQDSLASAAYFLFVRTFRQLEIGQGAAVSWILAVIIVLLTVLQFRYSRWVYYEA